jgi:Zn-finger nucleic acid-binding protein
MPSATCPSCRSPLNEEQAPAGSRWLCFNCGGAAEARPTLAKEAPEDAVKAIFAAGATGPGTRPCPMCRGPMGVARVDTDPPGGTDIDVCVACDLVWLDANDRAQIPMRMSADLEANLQQTAAEHDASVIAAPDRCPECGAPWSLDDGARCKFCGHQLIALQSN